MTDSAMFYPLFNKLQEKSIYSPKITDADVYLDFITKNQNGSPFFLSNRHSDSGITFILFRRKHRRFIRLLVDGLVMDYLCHCNEVFLVS